MATKEYGHNLDLLGVAQLLNARIHNVTDAQETALAGTLGAANDGLAIWNVSGAQKVLKVWDGTQFVQQAIEVAGDVIFRGVLAAVDYNQLDGSYTTGPANRVSGSEYVIGEAGTLDIDGVTTYVPSASVEVGDRILFTAPDTVYVIQRNDEEATETTLGNVRLATQAEVLTGTQATEAVTPATLQGKMVSQGYTRQYTTTVDIVAGVASTVTHNLNLVDRDAFDVTCVHGNKELSLEVTSVDANSLEVRGLVSRTGIRVTVQGASAA